MKEGRKERTMDGTVRELIMYGLCFLVKILIYQPRSIFFITNNQIHIYNTPSAQTLHIPLCRLNNSKSSVLFEGVNYAIL